MEKEDSRGTNLIQARPLIQISRAGLGKRFTISCGRHSTCYRSQFFVLLPGEIQPDAAAPILNGMFDSLPAFEV